MRRFGFIHNLRAGHGRQADIIHLVAARMAAQGHTVREYACPGDPARPVRQALDDGCDTVVACGGDGTVSGVARALQKSPAVLAVFPLGTLNHFARDLGIHSVAEAERVLLEGKTREVDAGALNGRLFINNSGIGIYPAIVLARDDARRSGIPKWPAFVIACVKALAKLPFLRLRLEVDGRNLARITPFLFVGNNIYETEGRPIGTRKQLDSGVLGICTARHHGVTGLIRIAFRALFGYLREDRDFTLVTAKRLRVRTKHPKDLHVSLDGEVVRMRQPLNYSIVPRAVRVLAP
ncbi:MAG TPA: diacylglycerol kinase family protein [Bryobacteraceae bacterium]|nr:diacylglycerol kinase family protein [Bryobacteraceae bacterium]